jgi:hypothetical protein
MYERPFKKRIDHPMHLPKQGFLSYCLYLDK